MPLLTGIQSLYAKAFSLGRIFLMIQKGLCEKSASGDNRLLSNFSSYVVGLIIFISWHSNSLLL